VNKEDLEELIINWYYDITIEDSYNGSKVRAADDFVTLLIELLCR